jgi:hypothetical protein
MKPKYRWRTKVRKFGVPIPKGKSYCGHHELYVAEQSPGGGAKLFHCKHCSYEIMDTTTINAERARQQRIRRQW